MAHPPTLPTEPLRSHAQAQADLAATLVVSDEAPRATDEARKQLFERLEKTPVAMVATLSADGGLRLRPLTTQKAE